MNLSTDWRPYRECQGLHFPLQASILIRESSNLLGKPFRRLLEIEVGSICLLAHLVHALQLLVHGRLLGLGL